MHIKLAGTLRLKRREIELLQSLLKGRSLIPRRVPDFESFLRVKGVQMRSLRAQSYLANPFPNSNFETYFADWYGFRLQQRYSRQGDPVIGKNQAAQFYPALSGTIPSQGYFFSSGQAATRTIMDTLRVHYSLSPKFENTRTYFETLELPGYSSAKPGKGFYSFYDSAAIDFDIDVLASRLSTRPVVIDTTCIDRTDARLGLLGKQLKAKNTPAILVRSHLKLDTFGAEYGTLGSILILNPASFPALARQGSSQALQTIQGAVKSVGGVLGHFTNVDSIYPFLAHPEITLANSQRLGRIRANAQVLNECLSSAGFAIRRRPHDYFLETYRKGSAPQRVSINIGKWRIVTGAPVYYSDSFGFDFSAITTFRDYHKKEDSQVLRIAPADLCAEDFNECLPVYQRIVEYFHS